MERAGFGRVSAGPLEDLKGIHFGAPRGECEIYYREDLWDGAKGYTVLHEACEIIHETLCYLQTGSLPQRKVCREADRFAAAVLMQGEAFASLADRSGLDVMALQRAFQCSYASVTLRLAEVVRSVPLMAILYEREESGDPSGWNETPVLRAKVVRWTRGFGTPASHPICGFRGGLPRRGRPIFPGSLAERVVRYGRAQYEREGGHAVMGRPVFWKGRLAKVSVVAVPRRFGDILGPQVTASDLPCRRRRRLAKASSW